MSNTFFKVIQQNAFMISLIVSVIASGSVLLYRVEANTTNIEKLANNGAITSKEFRDVQIKLATLDSDIKYMKEGIGRLEKLMERIDVELRTRPR